MEKITESQKELLAGYVVSVIATMKAMRSGMKLDDSMFDVIAEATAELCEIYEITPEMLDNIKTNMEFEITFNQKNYEKI